MGLPPVSNAKKRNRKTCRPISMMASALGCQRTWMIWSKGVNCASGHAQPPPPQPSCGFYITSAEEESFCIPLLWLTWLYRHLSKYFICWIFYLAKSFPLIVSSKYKLQGIVFSTCGCWITSNIILYLWRRLCPEQNIHWLLLIYLF